MAIFAGHHRNFRRAQTTQGRGGDPVPTDTGKQNPAGRVGKGGTAPGGTKAEKAGGILQVQSIPPATGIFDKTDRRH